MVEGFYPDDGDGWFLRKDGNHYQTARHYVFQKTVNSMRNSAVPTY
jgi:hypothetical protein